MAARRSLLTILLLGASVYGQATLAGTVLNARDGTPIPGVTLELDISYPPVTTGPDGRFRFPNLKRGNYYIQAEKRGFAKLDGHAIRLSAGETVSNLILRLMPESSISGQIRNAKGQPVKASVNLTHVDRPSQVAFVATENDGAFRLAALPAGRYKLSAQGQTGSPLTYFPSVLSHREGEVIQLGSGEQKNGVDIVLRELKTVSIRGRYDGLVPPGERISLWPDIVGDEPRGSVQGGLLDAERRFAIQLAAGEYRLKVLTQPQAGMPPNVIGHIPLNVADADIDNVVIPATPIRSVRARFNRPVTAQASFMLNPQERLGTAQRGKPVGDGTLVATGVSADRYSIMVGGLPEGFYVQSILAAGADFTTSGLDLMTGTATDIDIVLANNGGVVSGQAPAGSAIYIGRVSPHRTERELFYYQTVADAAGRFVISGIAPGEYTISARVNGKSSDPQTMRVAAGERLQVTLR